MQPNPNVKLVSGVALAVLATAAYLYLKVNHIDEAGLFALLSPLIMYLIIGGKVEAETKAQNVVLAKIDEQTNGVLMGKIRKVVAEEVPPMLDEALKRNFTALQSYDPRH